MSGDFQIQATREEQEKFGKTRMFPSLKLVDPWNPNPDDIHIEDIAHGLAIINRYTGGCPFPVAVGSHCIRMARRVIPPAALESTLPRSALLRAWQRVLAHLLHDASEALGLNDLASPTKKKPGMEEYAAAHKRSMAIVFKKFDLPHELLEDTKPEDDYDYRLECKSFYDPNSLFPGDRVREIAWREVEREFMSTYNFAQAKIKALEESA